MSNDNNDNESTSMAMVPHVPQNDTVANMMQKAEVLIASGLLPAHLRKPEQVVAVMLRGRELGIGPMEALTSINVIQGKVTSSTQLMLALIYRSGYLEDIDMQRGDPAVCMMKRKGMKPHTVKFGTPDARAMGLMGKDNYKKQPATMFLWRAIAMCARVVFPDVVGAVYTPDELGMEIQSDTAEQRVSDWEVIESPTTAYVHESDPRLARVRSLQSEGKTASEIADLTGISKADVRNLME